MSAAWNSFPGISVLILSPALDYLVFVALGFQHAKPMRHIAIYVLPRSTLFSHVIS